MLARLGIVPLAATLLVAAYQGGSPTKTAGKHSGARPPTPVVRIAGATFSRDSALLLLLSRVQTVAKQHARGNRATLWDVAARKRIWGIELNNGSYRPVGFLADGQTILLRTPTAFEFRGVKDGRLLSTITPADSDRIGEAVLTPDGKRVLSTDHRGINLWDMITKKRLLTFGHINPGRVALAVSADGQHAVTVGSAPEDYKTTEVRFWDAATGRLIHGFEPDARWGWVVALSPDGAVAATVRNVVTPEDPIGKPGVVLWKTRTGEILQGFPIDAQALGFSSNGKQLIVANLKNLALREVSTGKKIWCTDDGRIDTFGFALSPDTRFAFTGRGQYAIGSGQNLKLRLWRIRDQKPLGTLHDPPFALSDQ